MATGNERGAGSPATILIVGLGLIGGSLGLALAGKRDGGRVLLGTDIDAAAGQVALARGAIDRFVSLEDGVREADLVIVAAPVEAARGLFRAMGRALRPGTVVTDTCSVKEPVVRAAREELPRPEMFIGGHPMAGAEVAGIESAQADLFVGRPYFLTPEEVTSPRAFQVASWLAKEVGARPLAVSAREHDGIVAVNSHLPHLVAWALVRVAARWPGFGDAGAVSGGSFRDATRVALSNPRLWQDILARNIENVRGAAASFVEELERLLELVAREPEAFVREAGRARAVRLAMTEPVGFKEEEAYELRVVIANRPGELARVTTILGQARVNIENLEIVHGTGRGLLLVEVAGERAARAGADALGRAGYDVVVAPVAGE